MPMFRIKNKYTGILSAALALTLTACSSNADSSGGEREDSIPDTINDKSQPPVATVNVVSPPIITDTVTKPEECVIVFDASSSMRGYVDATVNGEFPGVISTLNNAGNKSRAYLFDMKKTPIDNFVSKIQHKRITWANESDLFGMVSEILNSAAANPQNCYALVTDGIISGTNAEIKADPTYNISKPAILKGKIDSIVGHIPSDKDISLLVVAFMAPFNGTYYKYNNDAMKLTNALRPFYVLVAGAPNQINHMRQTLGALKYEHMAQYGVVYPMNIKCNAKFAGGKYKYDKSMKDQRLEFELAIDKLPAYAQNIEYLNTNLKIIKVNSRGSQKTLTPAIGDGEGDYTIEINGNKATVTLYEKITLSIPATFKFNLKGVQPKWIEDMTTYDDIKNYKPDATLNLDYFLAPFASMNNAVYLNDVSKSIIKIIK